MSLGKIKIKEDHQRPPVLTSDSSSPTTPSKGDTSPAFCFQFGSPDFDEQKRDQARHDSSFRSGSDLPTSVAKRQLPRKDSVATDQHDSGEAYPVPEVKKDAQASVAPPANQTQKPYLLNMPTTSTQMPFHLSQSVTGSSIQMPMHMPLLMGNALQVQQQVSVPELQPYPLPPQGMMHQSQGLSFTPPLGGQLPPQLGNLGMGIAPQYPQQQGGKFGVPRKTTPVKITHPDTHEELRLDKRTDTYSDDWSSGRRSHPIMPQSQPIPSFAPSHSINYYSNSYNTNSMFYPPPSSLPLSGSQMPPNAQGPRINYPVGQGHQNISFVNSAAAHVATADLSGSTSKYEGEGVSLPSSKDKPAPELSKTKSTKTRGKKKRKEILQKAVDKESEKIAQNNAVPDDWEDAAEIFTPKLETSDIGKKAHGGLVNHEEDESGKIAKKYSRDFLLKFAEQCTDLPQGFEIASVPSSQDRPAPEPSRTKSTITRGKKKRKEILQKADAAGTISDLYRAYKGPEEKKETVIPSASAENNSIGVNLKQVSHEPPEVDAKASKKIEQKKAEPDDWEDAAEISKLKLETSNKGGEAHGGLVNHEEDGSGNIAKYSRGFLLKFAEQCTDLPQGFEIASDIAEALMAANIIACHLLDRYSFPSLGRIIDRQSGGSRLVCRAERDLRLDLGGYGAAARFWPGQGGNFGVLGQPRAQTPLSCIGGMVAAANHRQKGLLPSPQTPLQMTHKAEKKCEVGKVADEEESKQRQLKSILNELTRQNFEELFEQVKALNIDNAITLTDVISQIFDKVLMEPTFCELYANFCHRLAGELPDFSEDNEWITFKKLLLNKCKEEFESREQKIKAWRGVGLIWELYKKKMVIERIMHECIKKLFGEYENLDEEDVDALDDYDWSVEALDDYNWSDY
ncbi:hypothetical protein DITRI_Ditri13aG0009400 [Diplodiscus trichospermus]